jgi:hypothetical protein
MPGLSDPRFVAVVSMIVSPLVEDDVHQGAAHEGLVVFDAGSVRSRV